MGGPDLIALDSASVESRAGGFCWNLADLLPSQLLVAYCLDQLPSSSPTNSAAFLFELEISFYFAVYVFSVSPYLVSHPVW